MTRAEAAQDKKNAGTVFQVPARIDEILNETVADQPS
jgi:hypothetical protein